MTFRIRQWRAMLIAIFAVVALAGTAQARSLDDIIKSGQINIGIDLNSPPFGFQDEQQQPSGSEVATAQLMAKDLGVKLNIVPTTVANRVPYLQTDRVDVMLATFAITPDRAKSVWFSTPYGTTGSIVIAPANVTIKSYADLGGKKVATTRGSANELALNANAPKEANILRFDDDAAATAALVSGQAEVLATTPAIAAIIDKRFPEKHYELKFTIVKLWYGAGIARGATDLLQWVNTFMFFNIQNGNISQINEKWIGIPLTSVPTL